jgi:hypothetical protein
VGVLEELLKEEELLGLTAKGTALLEDSPPQPDTVTMAARQVQIVAARMAQCISYAAEIVCRAEFPH